MFGAVKVVSRLHILAAPNCGSLTAKKIFKQCLSREASQYNTNFVSWRKLTLRELIRQDALGQRTGVRQIKTWFVPKIRIPGVKYDQPARIETNPLKVNTNVKNNVILYRYEKPYFYKGSIVFAGLALIGLLAMADNVYLVLCRDLFNPDKPWMTRLYDHIMPLLFIVIGVTAGPAIFLTIWLITRRTIKYIVLHKGGKTVTMVLYHPLKGEAMMTVPLNNVSSLASRSGIKTYIPIKIRDTRLKYIADKNGHFVNPELFDVTVGIERFD